MTSKILAALLALVFSMVANAPGRLPASGPRSLAPAGTNSHGHQIASAAEPGEGFPADAGIDIDEWLERAQGEMNAGLSAWSQFDFSTLDLPIGASSHLNGERTDDPLRTLFASESFDGSFESFESFDVPEQLIRLAALESSRSNQISGGSGGKRGAFDSMAGSAGGSGGGGGIRHGATGDESSGGADDQDSKQEGPSPTTVPTGTEPRMSPPVADDQGSRQEGSSPTIVPTVTEPPVSVPEPASMGLLGLGLIGLGLARRRRPAVRV